jgi:hypothetical protein
MFRKQAVGSEVDSYCGRCKMVLNHMITAMVDDQPKRVRCLTCSSEHNHRVQNASAKRTKSTGKTSTKSSAAKAAMANRWSSLAASWDESAAKRYSIYDSFSVDDLVTHVTFGRGLVIDVPAPDRMITLFESGEKMLMQGKVRG